METQLGSTLPLTKREQLIERILKLPAEQVEAVAAFVEELEELEDAEDLAAVKARQGEPTIALDDYLRESGLTREEVEQTARAEGWLNGCTQPQ